jgi:hypothetical protein
MDPDPHQNVMDPEHCFLYFFQFLVIKTLDPDPFPDPDSLEMLDPDPDSVNSDKGFSPYPVPY